MRFAIALILVLCSNMACSSLWDPWLVPREQPENGVLSTLSLVSGGLGGAGNVDGMGAAARFASPNSVVADGTDTLYVADTGNHTIRKVVPCTGVVTTIVGTAGIFGSADGIGPAARFFTPEASRRMAPAICMSWTLRTIRSASSHLALAPWRAPRALWAPRTASAPPRASDPLRAWLSTGQAIGPSARFRNPHGIALDSAGNLYIADNNSAIRKLVLSTGMVTTLAGTANGFGSADGTGPSARFSYPYGLAADGADNLYVTDSLNFAIRKVVASTGMVTTIVGTAGKRGTADGIGSDARFTDPVGVGIDGRGNIYISDDSAIRKLEISTSAVTTIVGTASMIGSADGTGSAARFWNPSGMAAEGAGNLYITDTRNCTIRRIESSTGTVTTLAGTALMCGSDDGTGSAARFRSPFGIALDGAGNLYVADSSSTIRKIETSTGVVTTLAGTALMAGSSDGTGSTARFNSPLDVAADGAGNLYVADTSNSTIRKIVTSTGVVSTIAGAAGSPGSADGIGIDARFFNPRGIAVDGVGNLYVADSNNSTIRRLALSAGMVTTLAGTAGMTGSANGTGTAARFHVPHGLAVDGAGNLYVADEGTAEVRKIALDSAAVTTIVGVPRQRLVKLGPLPANLSQPIGLAVAPTGGLYIVDTSENVVLLAR